MTYIDYINRFNQFLESSALPPSAQLLYYKLLHIFNRAGWPPTVRVDNQRLMTLLGNCTEPTLILNRRKLIEAGFIRFHSGRKGLPSQYALCQFSPYQHGESNRESYRENDRESFRHIKNQTKKKTKTTPPKPPKGASPAGREKTYNLDELERICVLDIPSQL